MAILDFATIVAKSNIKWPALLLDPQWKKQMYWMDDPGEQKNSLRLIHAKVLLKGWSHHIWNQPPQEPFAAMTSLAPSSVTLEALLRVSPATGCSVGLA